MTTKLFIAIVTAFITNITKQSQAQNVFIPDPNFKAALVSNSAININKDGEIQIDEANAYLGGLFVNNLKIRDLTGIEAFINITSLDCSDNQLTSLDVSKNLALYKLFCKNNQIKNLDITQNNHLSNLDCSVNQLTILSANNGNNIKFSQFNATINPSLRCIQVDDASWSTINWTNIDQGVCFSKDCANTVHIPDPNFRAALVGNSAININGDGEIQIDEATAYFGGLYVNNLNISDLTGIEAFINITSLDCCDNQLTSLDISKNVNLNMLNCWNNKLTSLFPLAFSPPDIPPNITPIIALTDLNCMGNQLTNLDISQTINLTHLDCSNNRLISLWPISFSPPFMPPFIPPSMPFMALTDLKCMGNQLTNLDISQTINLRFLDCSYNQLTSLITNWPTSWFVPPNMALTDLHCMGNQIISLDVSSNTALRTLDCSNNQIISLDVSSNTVLTTLDCSNNQIKSLDVSFNANLHNLYCFSNQLTSLNVSQNKALLSLYCNSNLLTNLDVSHNTNLDGLVCYGNQLTSIDVSKNTLLGVFTCADNQISSLDITHNTALKFFYCYNNQLTSLNISNNKLLTFLYCYNNLLTSLDASLNKQLELLFCQKNHLLSLNVKNGNNTKFRRSDFDATSNPDLTCIQVDDAAWANTHWLKIDKGASFSENCNTNIGSTDWLLVGKLSAHSIRNIEIQIKGNVSKQAVATLYDVQGRIILVKNLNEGAINIIPTPHIKNGIYLLSVKDNERLQSFKICIKE